MQKPLIWLLAGTIVLASCSTQTQSEEPEEEPVVSNGINWRSDDPTAQYLSMAGINHWMNIEFDRAYTLWEHAVSIDPTLFAPHAMLSMMSRGEKREMHKRLAKEHVANENETSKLFVSLLDAENGDEMRSIWAQIRELSNGPFIQFRYAQTLGNPDDLSAALAELDKVIQFSEENGFTPTAAASYNMKAYMLQMSGDMDGATAAAEKYVDLWDGSNALDSRAEMYLFAGDTTNAIEWYRKTLEKYPFAQAARNHLEELVPEEDN